MPKSILILIDGYNLLFQSQLVGSGRGPKWLERARRRLLQFLEEKLTDDEVARTQIVFDASRPSDAQHDEITKDGIMVTFAAEHPEADDLIEEIIRRHSHPKTFRVVSSDNRIRRCARARRAISLDSESFLSELETRATRKPKSTTPEPSELDEVDEDLPSRDEVDYWLKQFNANHSTEDRDPRGN